MSVNVLDQYTPEALRELTPVYRASDYEEEYERFTRYGRIFDIGWSEVEVYDSPSGEVDIVVYEHKKVADTPYDVRGVSQESGDVRNATDVKFMEERMTGPLKSLYDFFGIYLTANEQPNGDKIYHVSVPNIDSFREKLDIIRQVTGYAPSVTDFDGFEHDYDTWAKSIVRGDKMVASHPAARVHDLLTHVLVATLIPESTDQIVSNHVEDLIANPAWPTQPTNPNAMNRLHTYLHSLDVGFSPLFMEKLEHVLSGRSHPEDLANHMRFLLDLPKSSPVGQEEAEKVLSRTKQILDLVQTDKK